jgi:PAS domain S-box-containing protein
MNISISQKISGGFFILIAIILAIGTLSFYHLNRIEDMIHGSLMDKANSRSLVKDITIRVGNISILIDSYIAEKNQADRESIRISISDEMRVINVFIRQIFSHELSEDEKKVLLHLRRSFDEYGERINSVLDSSHKSDEFTGFTLKLTTQLMQVDKLETELMYHSWSEAQKRINVIRDSLLFFSIAAFGIGLFLSFVNARSVVRPIRKLVRVLDNYGNGDFTVRAEVNNFDEIGFFARRFNIMLEQVNSYAEGLREKNEELNRKNRDIAVSRERVAIITDTAPDAIIVADRSWKLKEINKTGTEFFGTVSVNSIENPDVNLNLNLHEIGEFFSSKSLTAPDISSEINEFEWVFSFPDRPSFTGLVRIREISISDEMYYLLIITDITERKRSEETIQRQYIEIRSQYESLEQINSILEKTSAELKTANIALIEEKEKIATTLRSLGEGVLTAEPAGTIEYMNSAAEHITGYTFHDAVGRQASEIFKIYGSDGLISDPIAEGRHAAPGETVDFGGKVTLETRSGQKRTIAPIIAPIVETGGRPAGAVIVFRDITDRVRMEEEIIKASRIESLGIIAGGIAHDFNNLLTSIMGNISLAKLNLEAGDRYREILSEAEAVAKRTMDLTYQLLTFSRGGLPIKKIISVKDILIDTSVFVLRGSGCRPDFNVQADLWNADADEGQIGQVLHNLVLNAREAMADGGVIRVSAENLILKGSEGLPLTPGDYIKIEIQDAGSGIPQHNIQKIFDPYFTTKDSGHGLGLAITYSVIKKHNGFIDVSSWEGGSLFTVYLPADKSSVVKTEVPKTARTFAGKRLLMMDDEEIILNVAKKMFEHLGLEVHCARNGDEAVEMYKRKHSEGKPYDIAVIDLTIPGGMGGKETMEILSAYDPAIKAVVSSGYSNDPIMANYKDYGFIGVMVKPYKIDDLQNLLADVL